MSSLSRNLNCLSELARKKSKHLHQEQVVFQLCVHIWAHIAEACHATAPVPESGRLYNYLLMYDYSCCFFICTVFIQPGRVPPKTPLWAGRNGGNSPTGLVPNHCHCTPGGVSSNRRQNNKHISKNVSWLFIWEEWGGQCDSVISAAITIWWVKTGKNAKEI